jgi:tetratricopeptide (TPR) repeat protein
MLFEAFFQSGLILVDEGRLEEALRLFERALVLQPDSVQVAHAKNLAGLYTEGMRYWGADWGTAASSLQTLYRLAPDYRDVRDRLYEARVYHGDQLAEQRDWCGASDQYALALGIRAAADVSEKRQRASSLCVREPTAPSAPGPTPGLTPPTGVAAPTGTFVGSLRAPTSIGGRSMYVRGVVMNRLGQGIPGTRVRIGAWDWSAIAVTNGEGQYSFDGLSNPVTYELTLLDLPSQPFRADGVRGQITWVDFREAG